MNKVLTIIIIFCLVIIISGCSKRVYKNTDPNKSNRESNKRNAIESITDQNSLHAIAVNEELNDSMRTQALYKLTDQELLANAVLRTTNEKEVTYVVSKQLTDQKLLLKVEEETKNPIVAKNARYKRICITDDMSTIYQYADEKKYGKIESALARMRIALMEPVIVNKIGRVSLIPWCKIEEQRYGVKNNNPMIKSSVTDVKTASREFVNITIKKDGLTIAKTSYEKFPEQIGPSFPAFVTVSLDIEELLYNVLKQPEFDQSDLRKLAQSKILELRAAAEKILSDKKI